MAQIPRTATLAIGILTAIAFVVIAAMPGLAAALAFIPARWSGLVELPGAAPAFLTPFTSTLVHSGILHLAFNLLIFVWCGTAVERVLGRVSLILLYLVGAYTAAIAQWLTDPTGLVPMVGASGAVSAVVGAFALSFGRAKRVTNNFRLNRWIHVLWLLAAWVVLQMMMGWMAGGQGYLLATPAHIGGFLAGLLLQRPLLLWRYRSA